MKEKMKTLLRLEYLALFGLSILLFSWLDFSWWWYPLLFLAPDIGMVGYFISPRAGAVTYNILHFLLTAVVAYVVGALLQVPLLELAGVIILGHSSFDRLLGFGFKYPDSFRHTHLGNI